MKVAAGVLVAFAAGAPHGEAACELPGCLTVTATGAAHLTAASGTARYKTMADGNLVVVLTTAEAPRLTVVITRYAADAPATAEDFTIDTKRCEDDMDDEIDGEAKGMVSVSVVGGAPLSPAWMALGSSGTVRLGRSGAVITGTFKIKACGTSIGKDHDDVAVDLSGTFKAKSEQ